MLLFKYFKNQKKKEPLNELNVEVAEDALVVQDSGNTAFLTSSSLNVTPVVNRQPRRVTIGLLQGASDSKVKGNRSTGKCGTTKSRLYPNLEDAVPVTTQTRAKTETKNLLDLKLLSRQSVVKKDKTIHDVADDITCTLHCKLVLEEAQDFKFNQLHTHITKIQTLLSPSAGSPTYEYNFDNELDFKNQNIDQFNDAEKYRENSCETQKNSTLESSQNRIIFKKYHQAFKSYRGRNCDVIDCD